jgi:glycosyltransferase involved in cell wall biosynthesis
MTTEPIGEPTGIYVAMAIFAWNEERAIGATIRSLFQQSVFSELHRRGQRCEVWCVTNGCTDQTAAVAEAMFGQQANDHPCAASFTARVCDLRERGKVNAWNQFVHSRSAKEARFLLMMDADILIHQPGTVWNMLRLLEVDPETHVAVDRPCKDVRCKGRKSFRDKLSLAAARGTLAAEAQLCGQLYGIRAEVARGLYLPKDLLVEDGFIKALVCTDRLTHPAWPGRVRVAANAEHTFEAYTSPGAILKNQKRQIIGQTIVHVLVDHELKQLSISERQQLADTLRRRDAADPLWLKRLIGDHLRRTQFCWRLHPGLLGLRFHRLRRLGPGARIAGLPAAVAGFFAALAASFMAWRSLRSGCTDYWPPAPRAERESAPISPGAQRGPVGGVAGGLMN